MTSLVSPRAVLARVAAQVPADCRANLIVIGSLAAAYQLFSDEEETAVRTKDMDCLLVPRIEAVRKGRSVAEALLAAGWKPPVDGRYAAPGVPETPDERLPVARLAGRPAVAEWPVAWAEALRELHPGEWPGLGRRVGAGVRALLANEGDLREALEVSRAGLLASLPLNADEFRIGAERLLVDAIEPLEQTARAAGGA